MTLKNVSLRRALQSFNKKLAFECDVAKSASRASGILALAHNRRSILRNLSSNNTAPLATTAVTSEINKS